eukprot:gene17208-biopygen14810
MKSTHHEEKHHKHTAHNDQRNTISGAGRKKKKDEAYRVFINEEQPLDQARREIVDQIYKELEEHDQVIKYFLSTEIVHLQCLDRKYYHKVVEAIDKIYEDISEYIQNGSGWRLERVMNYKIHFFNYKPIKGGSYIPTPKLLSVKKAIINVQNKDDKCFMWAVLSALYPVDKDSHRTTKYDQSQLNLEGLTFPINPTNFNMIKKFEDNNNVSINIFSYEDDTVYPGRLTNQTKEKHLNLLLLADDNGNSRYCWIKSLSRLLPGRPGHKHNRERFYSNFCVSSCKTQESLNKHIEICKQNESQAVTFPAKKDAQPSLSNFKKQMFLPFIIYADFECMLEKMDDPSKYQKHTPISYGLYVNSIDGRLNIGPEVYTSEDCMLKFMNRMDELNEHIREIFKVTIPMKALTQEQQQHGEVTHYTVSVVRRNLERKFEIIVI